MDDGSKKRKVDANNEGTPQNEGDANQTEGGKATAERQEVMDLIGPATTELLVKRIIDAQPEEVYDAWLNAKAPGSPWFGVAKAIVNAEVDGLFYHLVQFGGRDWAHYGRFVVLDRPTKIQLTWVSPATKGLETILTLTFDAEGDKTSMRIHHINVPDDEMGRQHEQGWQFCVQGIADHFAKLAPKEEK